jgi:hypothetical protein
MRSNKKQKGKIGHERCLIINYNFIMKGFYNFVCAKNYLIVLRRAWTWHTIKRSNHILIFNIQRTIIIFLEKIQRTIIMAEVLKFIYVMILLLSLLFVATKVCGGGKSFFHHFQISFFPSYFVDNLFFFFIYIMF